ncbi:MAG: hypothetical protein JWN45_576 [Acidobacteriaceae bacterium]|nr:hypothetical protein [Acidobacteriaceae bacterium]
MNLPDLAKHFKDSDELKHEIVRDIGSFAVALLAVFPSPQGDMLRLAGSGTLVNFGEDHAILTAAHVWEEVLKSAAKFGITVTENIDHRFLIDTNAIVPLRLQKPTGWNEWGPDIVLLRIPNEFVGKINAHKSFYHPTIDGIAKFDSNHVEMWMLMGAPSEFGKFTQNHADLEMQGTFLGDEIPHERNGFDYLDFRISVPSPGVPQSFGGVSGGGLWKVMLYYSNKIQWARNLEGVAFFELPIEAGKRTVRCHGPETVSSMLSPPAK